MFESNGILSRKNGGEFSKCFMIRKLKNFLLGFSLIYFLLGVVGIILGKSISRQDYVFYGVISIILAAYALWIIFEALFRFKVNYINVLKEISDKEEFEFKVSFNENGVNINNLTTSYAVEIKYKFFHRFFETPNMYILFTQSGQYAIVFKNCLNNEEINTFEKFIKEKCKNIK